ncbi:copper-translocating P-type ATPase [Candidatus Falkowbacteria bacterium CG_4_10_14_0_8_um_filter_41_36]|uniref:Copper-translocating P-type ATPase n=3 Tax=Candidatus Falkowiibacteriota TaxID=1752728 RepID=A0A2G9ZMP6_9BACT|nr:MAG: copper-translocating P-type ATPase [Candidatus Falkowbacteria bacterium CG1_02_41_21]PIP34414.1 MAG: copper-translocating P-type ATPase [Candidatus Falkowbacteria bacterium CG23_combo_of_CG06-09_8_20_14_all_41_10]PIZ09948.1 MAG: copper-translocating P-type ATPase [Candidatus Falkowbacteria bacterium CG_4_10_14_0_8_um_filter_41_36]
MPSIKKVVLPVAGMHCASCSLLIEKTLKASEGVKTVNVNFANAKVTLEYDASQTAIPRLNSKIKPLGYELKTSDLNLAARNKQSLAIQKNKILWISPIIIYSLSVMAWDLSGGRQFILFNLSILNVINFGLASFILLYIGRDFIRSLFNFFKTGRANMDTLVGMGILTAYVYSTVLLFFPQLISIYNLPANLYFDATIIVSGFVFWGKYLEARAKLKTSESIEKLLNLQAKTALVWRENQEIEVPVEQLIVNDVVIVKPGAKVPTDGVVIEGASDLDESLMTGESMLVSKNIGDAVIGSTINKQGYFKFRATKLGPETLLANIVRAVEEAQGSKAPIQRLADKISQFFVPTIMIIAGLTFLSWLIVGLFTNQLNQFLPLAVACFVAVLVIACPCALGLATPTGIIMGTGLASRYGILIKNAEALEKLHNVRVVLMDKTGTITKGKPAVIDFINFSDKGDDEILAIFQSLEKQSEHPLAQAVMNYGNIDQFQSLNVKNFAAIPGQGIEAEIDGQKYSLGNQKLMTDSGLDLTEHNEVANNLAQAGKTVIFLAAKDSLLALMTIADPVKTESLSSIKALQKLGIKVVMLSGDHLGTANYIANQVGISEVMAEVLPNGKGEKILEYKARHFGQLVAMVGDGVNDAPALAAADISIAMSTGSDIAIATADITLLHGDLEKLIKAIRISKLTIKKIKQNLFWAFFYNIVAIPVAAGLFYPFTGWLLSPALAAAAMSFSSISVVWNSLLMKRIRL